MITVIQEHSDFLYCYKNEGLDFHNSQEGPGFFTQLKEQYSREELYPLHRLDKLTSGGILVARNREAVTGLGELLSSGQMNKVYLGLSDKKPKKKQGWIVGDMERSRRGQWILKRSRENPARTYFHSMMLEEGIRLFKLKIYTGKTHQIRVAMKSLGAPILGDPLYGPSQTEADRCYLHAWRLSFVWKDEPYDLECLPRSGRLFSPLKERERLDPAKGALLELPSFPVFP